MSLFLVDITGSVHIDFLFMQRYINSMNAIGDIIEAIVDGVVGGIVKSITGIFGK